MARLVNRVYLKMGTKKSHEKINMFVCYLII